MINGIHIYLYNKYIYCNFWEILDAHSFKIKNI